VDSGGVPVRSDRVYRLLMRLGAGLFRLLDLRREPHGEQHIPTSGPAVLAVSHFGYLDFALVQQVVWRRTRRFVRFLVTDAAFSHPLAGPVLRAMNHIPVNRRAGAGAFRMAERALEQGELVGIFPESAVSLADELLPFKPGAAALASKLGVPVVPVVVWGGQRVITKGLPLRWKRARHAPIHLEFGAALHFAVDADPLVATAELRASMSAMVARLVVVAPERSAGRLAAAR
jgi:1-acyl-sn-glycerol-3-phosphate acyltransferase